jgi:hypothetical protein
MLNVWRHMMEYGSQHGVNPVFFAVLYMIHHPLFWGTMAWLVKRAREHKPVRSLVPLAAGFWLMPYAYVVVFGRNLPVWMYGAVAVVVLVGGVHVVQTVTTRLKANTEQAHASQRDR